MGFYAAMGWIGIGRLNLAGMAVGLADRAVQIHGGMGVMRELPIERIFRMARVLRIVEGTDEIQKETIAKGLGL